MKKASIIILLLLLSAGQVMGQDKKGGKESEKRSGGPAGYGSLQWGSSVDATKENVSGKITFIDEKRVIISRDGDIEYRYGFFFREPGMTDTARGEKKALDAEKDKTAAGAGEAPEAKLYYVLLRFPYLHMDDVKKRITDKYGEPTGEDIKKNQGALIWDFEKTSIIMWVDDYEKEPFCRKITYLGKDISSEVNDYRTKVFTAKELEILRNLNP